MTAGISSIDTVPMDLFLANFDEAVGGSSGWEVFARRGAQLAELFGSVVLVRSDLVDHTDRRSIGQRLFVSGISTSRGAIEGDAASDIRILANGRVVRPLAQVWSEEAVRFLGVLENSGVVIDRKWCPSMSPARISHLCRKTGGHEFFGMLPRVATHRPAATVCNSVSEVATLLAELPTATEVILKTDQSMGGVGVWEFSGGKSAAAYEEALHSFALTANEAKEFSGVDFSKPGKSGLSDFDGPFLVELKVSHDSSPTLDLLISGSAVEVVGLAEQLLGNDFRYLGAMDAGNVAEPLRAKCLDLGEEIGQALMGQGYRGFANLDFVASVQSGDVWLIEANLRQSAPFDQHVRAEMNSVDSWVFFEPGGGSTYRLAEIRRPLPDAGSWP